jgi:hypothetical protein
VDVDSGGGGSAYEAQLQKMDSEMAQLRMHYGPQHPAVRKLQAEIDELKKRATEQQKGQDGKPVIPSGGGGRPVNPVIEAQIAGLDRDSGEQLQLEKSLQSQINQHLNQLEKMPEYEQRIGNIQRDYETLRLHYTDLMNKKLASDTAINLETRQKGERFVILDPAPVPDAPVSPKRLIAIVAALVGGLIGGFALVIGLELAETGIRTSREAQDVFQSPVLVEVIRMQNASEQFRDRVALAGSIAGAMVASAALGLALSIATARLSL